MSLFAKFSSIKRRSSADTLVLNIASVLQNAIYNSTHFSSIATDAKGIIQIFNVGAETMLGHSALDVINIMTPADLSDADELRARADALSLEYGETITCGFEALIYKAKRGIEDIYELTYICKNGHRLPAMISVTALRDDAQMIIGYLLIGTDNTARKNAEEALSEGLFRWKFALESAGDGVWDWNIKTDEAVYSPRWKSMLGYSEHDIQPTNQEWQARIHPDDQAMVAITMQAYLAGISPNYRVEYRLRCKDESYKWILGRGMVVSRDQSGQPLHMIGTHTDISELKDAQLSLEKYKQIAEFDAGLKTLALEQSQSAVIITDLNAHIEYVNQAYVDTYGFQREDLIGQNPSKVQSGITPSRIYKLMWKALRDGKVWRGELVNLSAEGNEIIVWTMISPIRQADGKISHYLCVQDDITEIKEKEKQLEAALARAEHLAKTKAQFLANMSHEIRTPMNAILGLSDLSLLEDNSAELSVHVQHINTAATHLLAILNDILDLSKLEAGGLSLMPAAFDLDELLTTVRYLFLNAASSKGLDISVARAQNVPAILVGDSLRLRQVLINLLGNAIKFTERGSVNLICNLQQIEGTEARLLFSIMDTGIGIPSDAQDKLFQPFSQLDDGYTRNFGGTGLGLVISQELIQLMGSSITVESRFGLGSCFSFELLLPVVSLSELDGSVSTDSLANVEN